MYVELGWICIANLKPVKPGFTSNTSMVLYTRYDKFVIGKHANNIMFSVCLFLLLINILYCWCYTLRTYAFPLVTCFPKHRRKTRPLLSHSISYIQYITCTCTLLQVLWTGSNNKYFSFLWVLLSLLCPLIHSLVYIYLMYMLCTVSYHIVHMYVRQSKIKTLL